MARILLADDDVNLLLLVKTMLKSDGHEVMTVSSGSDALRIGEAEHFDLYVLDVTMPDWDGYKLSGLLTKKFPDRKVILLTARRYVDDKVSSDASGAVFHIEKPFDRKTLLEKVREALTLKEKE